jgi:5-methylcytosine-specific restriction endonuclease McrA
MCQKKPRISIKVKKPMKKRGKHNWKWKATREKWFKDNPAPFYACYICGTSMAPEETTLDHMKSRGRHPELRYELSNLAPCCLPCNFAKGSLGLEEFKEKRIGSTTSQGPA